MSTNSGLLAIYRAGFNAVVDAAIAAGELYSLELDERADVAGLRAVAAAAWMEGFDAGERDVWEHEHTKGWDGKCTPNPYSANALILGLAVPTDEG